MDANFFRITSTGRFFRMNLFLIYLVFLFPDYLYAQANQHFLKGKVTDQESHQSISGVSILCKTCIPPVRCVSDSLGSFKLVFSNDINSFSFSHLGYFSKQLNNVKIEKGMEIFVPVELSRRVYQIWEIDVKTTRNLRFNPMATVSVHATRSQDALRYATGYLDVSRIVSNFAGVVSDISDAGNDIVIRGNSPRGLLWRLEGIEIPNPNHFSCQPGSSGGFYSAISTNVLSDFDFFTGAFPAEFGNATSGVIDLNLRNGNTENHRFSFAFGMLGMEASAEGPVNRAKGSTYLADYRTVDYKYLTRFGILDEQEGVRLPKMSDYSFKASLKTNGTGSLDFFVIGGSSEDSHLITSYLQTKSGVCSERIFTESQTFAVAGVKHRMAFPDKKTDIRSTLGFTYAYMSNSFLDTDTLHHQMAISHNQYEYPAFRFASLINHKFNARNSLQVGITFNHIRGRMFARQLKSELQYDTLLNTHANGSYGSSFAHWKYKSGDWLETNTGLHVLYSGITREVVFEPRWGMIIRPSAKHSFNFGMGFHSRLEPMSLYYYKVNVDGVLPEERNNNLKTTKAFHLITGYTRFFSNDLHATVEAYMQYLWAIPMNKIHAGQFSLINLNVGIPNVKLENTGKSSNKGLEFTLEKLFSRHYYFLATASLFNSKYLAPNGFWYNTYFNTNYVGNLLIGKEFLLGKHLQNVFGIKLRGNYHGGFRFTPVDQLASLNRKTVVYVTSQTYGERLPDFNRFDFGLSYRINKKRNAWVLFADIQNILDTKNIYSRTFEYWNKQIITYDSKGFGRVPVLTLKAEF